MSNANNSGTLRVLVYQEAPKRYIGVAFEFGIVETGSDPEMLYYQIMAAAKNFLQYVREKRLPIRNLNKTVDAVFEKKWKEALSRKEARKNNGLFARLPLSTLQQDA